MGIKCEQECLEYFPCKPIDINIFVCYVYRLKGEINMVRVAELTIYNNNDEELDKDYAIVISLHRKIKEREVRRICSRIFEDKITDIKWDNYA